MDNMNIRAGARLNFTVTRANEDAVSATFIASNGTTIITDTIDYDEDGNAYFEFDSPQTDEVGEYEFQVNENFATGSPDIYPSVDDCDGDCSFPVLNICESLSEAS